MGVGGRGRGNGGGQGWPRKGQWRKKGTYITLSTKYLKKIKPMQ